MLRKLRPSFSSFLIGITAALTIGPAVAVPAYAQTTGGAIVGVVSDVQSGVLPVVTLTARNAETGVVRANVSEADGRYLTAGLAPGRSDAKAALGGFSDSGL